MFSRYNPETLVNDLNKFSRVGSNFYGVNELPVNGMIRRFRKIFVKAGETCRSQSMCATVH